MHGSSGTFDRRVSSSHEVAVFREVRAFMVQKGAKRTLPESARELGRGSNKMIQEPVRRQSRDVIKSTRLLEQMRRAWNDLECALARQLFERLLI